MKINFKLLLTTIAISSTLLAFTSCEKEEMGKGGTGIDPGDLHNSNSSYKISEDTIVNQLDIKDIQLGETDFSIATNN